MHPALILAVLLAYWVESWASVRRVMAIRDGRWSLLAWDALLTILPFTVLAAWVDSSGWARVCVVVSAVAGSTAGVLTSGVLRR